MTTVRRRKQNRDQLDKPTLPLSKPKSSSFEELQSRIKPIKSVESYIKALIYGRSGTGKTTLAASFPKPILMIDIREKGTESVADIDGIFVISAADWNDCELLLAMLESKPDAYKTVVIDTVSMGQTMLVENILEDENEERMTQRLWGEVSGKMQPFVVGLRDLPMHVVFIAHDRVRAREEDGDGDLEPEVGPALIPSVAKTLTGAVSVIGYSYIAEQISQSGGMVTSEFQYRLRVGPHPVYTTKIRSPQSFKLPESIHNPTFSNLQKLVKGEAK